jgi:sugar phosphate isomerase/epimerase
MKLGFCSAILPDLSLDEVLAFAASEGYACVEVMCWPPSQAERRFSGVTHLDVTAFTPARADEVRALTARHRVAISALGYYPNPLDPDPAVAGAAIEHLRHVIHAAALLGLRNVNTFIGRDWHRTVDDNWPRFLEIWRPLIALAEERDIRIGIENCPMLFTRDEWPGGKNLATTPPIWRRMFADLPSAHFGLNFDPSHFIFQQLDWMRALREFAPRLHHIHAKDMWLHRDRLAEVGVFALPTEYYLPRIPGFGEVNWAHFIGTLIEVGYDGAVCVEVEDDTFGRTLEGRKNALRVSRQILAPYFP